MVVFLHIINTKWKISRENIIIKSIKIITHAATDVVRNIPYYSYDIMQYIVMEALYSRFTDNEISNIINYM